LKLGYESRRASVTSWQVSAVREDAGGSGPSALVTAIVDCRSTKLTAKKATGTKAVAAKKKKAKKLRINTPAATGSAIAFLMGSSPVNGSWQVSAFNFSPVGGTLGSRAYCA
jgi:hypothetical protein